MYCTMAASAVNRVIRRKNYVLNEVSNVTVLITETIIRRGQYTDYELAHLLVELRRRELVITDDVGNGYTWSHRRQRWLKISPSEYLSESMMFLREFCFAYRDTVESNESIDGVWKIIGIISGYDSFSKIVALARGPLMQHGKLFPYLLSMNPFYNGRIEVLDRTSDDVYYTLEKSATEWYENRKPC